jgi:hypothetical protein
MGIVQITNNLIFSLHVGNGVESDVFAEIVNLTKFVYGEKGVSILTSKIRCTQGKYYFKDSIESSYCVICLVED